jgi:energy-coupling factor transporter ATP-binding protein EcfA2
MNASSSISVAALLGYWRNSLADEDLMGLDSSESPVRTTMEVINSGRLNAVLLEALQSAWQSYQEHASWDKTAADSDRGKQRSVPIVIFAKGFAPRHEHGRAVGSKPASRKSHYTLHIPAVLAPDGALSCSGVSLPWIGREYLLPNEEAEEDIPMVGELERFDAWLSRNPLDTSSWPDLTRWCEGLWEHVASDHIPDGFEELSDIPIDIAKSIRNSGRHLSQLYDALLAEEKVPDLLARISLGHGDPVVVGPELRRIQLAASRGTMSTAYGLANSQADAIAAFTKLGPGEILAINGPPGTGKTTLLQSIIATEVVARAMAGGDPAVIVGASTNNQAVVNINDSLNKILNENPAATQFPWAKRWVPDGQTYGLYLPAGDEKAGKAEQDGYAVAVWQGGRTYSGFPEREQDLDFVDRSWELWLQSYQDTYGSRPETIKAGLDVLRANLADIADCSREIQAVVDRFFDIDAWWRRTAGDSGEDVIGTAVAGTERAARDAEAVAREAEASRDALYDEVQQALRHLEASVVACEARLRDLVGLKARILSAMAPHGLVDVVAGLIPPLRDMATRGQLARLCAIAAQDAQVTQLFTDEIRSDTPTAWTARIEHLISSVDTQLQQLRDAKAAEESRRKTSIARADRELAAAVAKQNAAVRHLGQLKGKTDEFHARRAELRSTFETLKEQASAIFLVEVPAILTPVGGVPNLSDLDWLLDVTWRHKAFQLAMRYWEGRWILEAEGIREGKVNTKRGRVGMAARFRRWCMLTPCLVTTLHSLPKHFRYASRASGEWLSDFMFGFIDLLIMDEAGQVGPHIGGASFALAKRAVVVGDIYQIEPVCRISQSTDYANSARLGLQDLWIDGEPASPHLVSEPKRGGLQGSIMRLAQEATSAMSPGTEGKPGIFLSEHRRCCPEIVEYCNRLVYRGRLEPLSPPRKKAPVPPLAWAHVHGAARKLGGGQTNASEAAAIAGWISANAERWCRHYGKPLNEIVAVVTPFRSQARLIKTSLPRAGPLCKEITVGTVHSLQGAERPIVIFSPTYDADSVRGVPFFDRKPNMLNVAVSRAMDSFVVIGDMRLFRRKGRSPSAVLGSMLFADDARELLDVDGNHRFPRELLVRGERISILERHREVLRHALTQARATQIVLIASPWISVKAVEDDKLGPLVADAVRRGARVRIVVDGELALQNPKHRGREALEEIRKAGASIHIAAYMHSKTLIAGPAEIIEGSFNWLSANRQPDDPFVRHEISWRITGDTVAPVVQSALEECTKLTAEGIARPRSPAPGRAAPILPAGEPAP